MSSWPRYTDNIGMRGEAVSDKDILGLEVCGSAYR